MPQKEIIHLSFGSIANHISTHFWNQQQSYFTYDQVDDAHAGPSGSTSRSTDEDEPLVDHDVSFQAGQTLSGHDTYNPRAVIFEIEQEFGALAKLNALYDSFPPDSTDRNVALDSLQSWGAEAQVIASQRIRKSAYQRRLELEDQGIDPGSSDDEAEARGADGEHAAATPPQAKQRRKQSRMHRFWSDYSRTYFHAKSLVSVGGELTAPMLGSYNSAESPEANDGRVRFETFSQGAAHFDELEKRSEVLDTNLRWFAEDADLLQGFQYTIGTSDAFGGLGAKYLENLVDEFPKITHLVFGSAWGNTTLIQDDQDGADAAWQNRLARIRKMNNLLSLVQLMEYSSALAPVCVPHGDQTTQVGADWQRYLGRMHLDDMHHASALLSAHIETATLGTRLRSRTETLGSLVSRLNWRRDTKLVHLGGVLPVPYPVPLSSSSLKPTSSSADPVDALLHSYGYGDRDSRQRQRGAPLESQSQLAARGAQLALSSWIDLSLPPSLSGGASRRKELLYNLQRPFSHHAVLRNSNLDDAVLGLGMLDSLLAQIREPFGQGVYVPQSYNILSSFPNVFTHLDAQGKPIPRAQNAVANPAAEGSARVPRPKHAAMLSSLGATPSTIYLLRDARNTLSEALGGHAPLAAYGLDAEDAKDNLKEIREQVEGWIDTYSVDNDANSADNDDQGGMGTDEEYDVDHNPDDGLDWDL
ncbi:hypothetical protein PaG_00016 [Moesziomyces aphidis]|uniref:Uncharacterized protein n=1 Tax=Moesziomyces aphidis TaxID=84754 RepID=W3VUK8_MOEAP|nr:hypothetical protein PaG_00016 [Moesziomyces aphidis]